MKTDAEKLKEFRQKYNISQAKLAKELGCSTGLIASIEIGDRSISLNLNQKIIERYNENLSERNIITKPLNLIEIPVYDIGAAAGKGTWLSDETKQDVMYFDKRVLKQILKTENYSHLHIIHAAGDSMDSGWNQPNDIKDGDLLLIDSSQTTGNNQIFVILVNNNELRVKKLFKRGEALYISSNNPKYKEEVYYPDNTDVEIRVIGKVVWNGSKENV